MSKKKKNGKYYYYLEERAWINGKSQRLWQKYIGPEDKLHEMKISFSPQKLEYKTMEFGGSAALLQIIKKIGIIEIINDICGKQRDQNLSLGEYFIINTINRCLQPSSKSKMSGWFEQDYLSHVYGIDPKILNAQTYWNHFQRFSEEAISKIEEKITQAILAKYQIPLFCLLFDPTNFYTFINYHEDQQLAAFGHSKENRNNLRIINLSILCTLQFGIPLFHQTYEGNVHDAKHFKGILSEITNRFKALKQDITELVLIFDKGNHSQKAFQDIDSIALPFIASLKNSTQKDLLDIPLDQFTIFTLPSNGKEVGYYRTRREIYNTPRTLYVIYDPSKNKKQTFLFEQNLEKKLVAINTFLTKLNIKKWRSKQAVEEKLSSLIGKQPFSSVISYIVQGLDGELQVDIQTNTNEKDRYTSTLGRTIIFTSQNNWSPVQVIQAFRDKYVVEDTFKQLKNPRFLALRPMYHWSNPCIRAHVFSCVVGLLLLSLFRFELGKKYHSYSYEKLIEYLKEIQLTNIYTSSTGSPYYKLNKISPEAMKIYQKLQLKKFLPK